MSKILFLDKMPLKQEFSIPSSMNFHIEFATLEQFPHLKVSVLLVKGLINRKSSKKLCAIVQKLGGSLHVS